MDGFYWCCVGFYSKLVRLKALQSVQSHSEQWSFYSKLVRLKANDVRKPRTTTRQFLFQTGAIKSWGIASIYAGWHVGFLFQTGAIKSFLNLPAQNICMRFLFQTGAIKSRNTQGIYAWDTVSIPNVHVGVQAQSLGRAFNRTSLE